MLLTFKLCDMNHKLGLKHWIIRQLLDFGPVNFPCSKPAPPPAWIHWDSECAQVKCGNGCGIEVKWGGGLRDSTCESKVTIIPLLMQSVALYIVAFVVLERFLCSRLFDNVTITEIREECELLMTLFFFLFWFVFTTHRFSKSLLLDANRLIRKFYCLISQIPIDSKKYFAL